MQSISPSTLLSVSTRQVVHRLKGFVLINDNCVVQVRLGLGEEAEYYHKMYKKCLFLAQIIIIEDSLILNIGIHKVQKKMYVASNFDLQE